MPQIFHSMKAFQAFNIVAHRISYFETDIERHLQENWASGVVLRQKYWIIGATAAIKRIGHHCVTCRKYQGRSNQP